MFCCAPPDWDRYHPIRETTKKPAQPQKVGFTRTVSGPADKPVVMENNNNMFVFVVVLSRKLHGTRTDAVRSTRSSRPSCSVSRSLLVNLEVPCSFRNI